MFSTLLLILIIIFLVLVSSFIPIGNEKSTVRRLPWITFSIMAINVIIFYVTLPAVANQQDQMMKLGSAIEQFVEKHPEILVDEGARKKLLDAGVISKAESDQIAEQIKKSPDL